MPRHAYTIEVIGHVLRFDPRVHGQRECTDGPPPRSEPTAAVTFGHSKDHWRLREEKVAEAGGFRVGHIQNHPVQP
jgi:hypothetical protein